MCVCVEVRGGEIQRAEISPLRAAVVRRLEIAKARGQRRDGEGVVVVCCCDLCDKGKAINLYGWM